MYRHTGIPTCFLLFMIFVICCIWSVDNYRVDS
jgi:hypothetical protein